MEPNKLKSALQAAPFEAIQSEYQRRVGSMPKPKLRKMRPCKHCGVKFAARDLRIHAPRCAKNPRAK